jgi:hypothetical protein
LQLGATAADAALRIVTANGAAAFGVGIATLSGAAATAIGIEIARHARATGDAGTAANSRVASRAARATEIPRRQAQQIADDGSRAPLQELAHIADSPRVLPIVFERIFVTVGDLLRDEVATARRLEFDSQLLNFPVQLVARGVVDVAH